MIANDNRSISNDDNDMYAHKKRKLNEEIIDYKQLYEKEQQNVKLLQNEIKMIRYECISLIEKHALMQTSITVLQVYILYQLFKIFIIIYIYFINCLKYSLLSITL